MGTDIETGRHKDNKADSRQTVSFVETYVGDSEHSFHGREEEVEQTNRR